MTSCTLVTCLFDLGSREKSNRRSVEEYRKYGEFHFQNPCPYIFIVDRNQYDYIWKRRAAHNLLHMTYILPVDIEELPLYQKKPLMDRHYRHGPKEIKDTTLYMIVCWSKISFCIHAAMKLDPFKTSHFAWIDFGITHVAHIPQSLPFIRPTCEKINLVQVNPPAQAEMKDMEKYLTEPGRVAAGFMIGHKTYWLKLIPEFNQIVELALAKGWTCLEENIIAWLVGSNPELFDLSYGGYAACITNIGGVNMQVDQVIRSLKIVRRQHDMETSHQIATVLKDSLEKKLCEWTPRQCLQLWDELTVICASRGDSKDRYQSMEKFASSCATTQAFREEFHSWDLANRSRIMNNFGNAYYTRKPAMQEIVICVKQYDEKTLDKRLTAWTKTFFFTLYHQTVPSDSEKKEEKKEENITYKHLYPHNPWLRQVGDFENIPFGNFQHVFYQDAADGAKFTSLSNSSPLDTLDMVLRTLTLPG